MKPKSDLEGRLSTSAKVVRTLYRFHWQEFQIRCCVHNDRWWFLCMDLCKAFKLRTVVEMFSQLSGTPKVVQRKYLVLFHPGQRGSNQVFIDDVGVQQLCLTSNAGTLEQARRATLLYDLRDMELLDLFASLPEVMPCEPL